MAKKTVVLLIDDVDGGDATQTITFALDGVAYEIDLNDKNAAKLRKAFQPWVDAGRRVGGGATRRRRTSPAAGTSDPERTRKIRQWAADQGMQVPPRGRLPRRITDAYDAAH